MPEPTVRCACGRTMNPAPSRGRGHYHCGCGTRVHITIPAPRGTRCVAAHRGEPCRLPPVITEPLPLCDDHYTETGLRRYASWWKLPDDELANRIAHARYRIHLEVLGEDTSMFDGDYWTRRVADNERELRYRRSPEGRRRDREQADTEAQGIVYFIRSGTAVKIGKTLDVVQRMRAINAPEMELLATEPGYTRRERELHRQFRHHRLNGEWFRLTPPLAAHINALRTPQGLPPVQTNIDNPQPTL